MGLCHSPKLSWTDTNARIVNAFFSWSNKMIEYITEDELRIKLHELVEDFLGKLSENDVISQVAILLEKNVHRFAVTPLGGGLGYGDFGGPERSNNFENFSTIKESILNSYKDLHKSDLKFTRASREFLDVLEK